ncbi:MAG TPA: biotin--[acetyl-CoA-carboxylase] ligase [Pararobbsia sp.]|nr:biotin--[acetyl-CoA-carboxylase] ligase [Pararobbsia sp.]
MSAVSPGLGPTSAHLRTIDRARLDGQLSPEARAWQIDVVEQTTSTNADLLEALRAERAPPAATPARNGLANARVRVAYEQTAGRGRRGRNWVAQPGEALLFSVGGWLPRGIDGLGGLSLAVGLAVHDALRELPVDASRVALKWPNDVLVDGAKVSGILIETAISTRGATALVIGIGINLRGAAAIARGIEQARSASEAGTTSASAPASAVATPPPTPPTALDAIWAEPSMTDLLARLVNRLAETLGAFGAEGFAPLRAAWCEADSYRDLPVALYEGGPVPTTGVARGVDDSGHLLIETPAGLRTVASGDVSLRAA